MGGLRRASRALGAIAAFALAFSLYAPFSVFAEKWPGVDEAVVEKVAREHGREAKPPLIDPGRGDLLLFLFLAAGTAGGFAAGYYWRKLMDKGTGKRG